MLRRSKDTAIAAMPAATGAPTATATDAGTGAPKPGPPGANTTTPPAKPGLLKRLGSALADFPWGKLIPKPDIKKAFGPFLLVLTIALLITYAFVIKAVGPSTSGQALSVTKVMKAAEAGLVKRAVFKEQDANLLLRIADPSTFTPAPVDPAAAPPPAAPPPASATPTTPPTTAPPIEVPGKVRSYWMAYASSDAETGDLTDALLKSGADITHDHQNTKKVLRFLAQFLMPLLILAAVFGLFFLVITGQAGGGGDVMGFSKFASKIQRRKKGTKGAITFANVAGNEESLIELQEVVDYLMNPEQYAELGARAPKGVLLCGPPGTGKTLLAKAVAGEAAVPYIQLSGSEFVESLVGVGAARVRSLFQQARDLAPCIIFIDELDAAGRQRGAGVGGGNDEREQTLNQLLVEMDGFSSAAGIAVLGATNRPDILDPALLRPGRFDRQIVIDVPDVTGRQAILKIHMKDRPIDDDVDLDQIAKQVPGFTGAELANIVNEAALLAVRRHRHQICQLDMEEAVDRVLAGPERRSHILSQDEKLLIAYHEAGHAVVARGAGQTTGVLKLSVVARGLQLGHASTYSSADRLIQLDSELRNQLTTLLGGLAAERLVFGQMSTGNAGDLEKATTLARKMVATWGMSDKVGRVQVLNEGAVFMGRDFASASHTSVDALNTVDAELQRVLREAEDDAYEICRVNRKVLDEIVGELLERETMVGPELEPILAKVKVLRPALGAAGLIKRPSNGASAKRPRRTAAAEPEAGHLDGHADGHLDGHADGHADGHLDGHVGTMLLEDDDR